MITLYHVNAPGAYRVIWLLEELQLAYQLANSSEGTDVSFAACQEVTLNDKEHYISGISAITNYLLNRYDRKGLRPPITSDNYTTYEQWLSLSETHLLPLLQKYALTEKLANTRVPFFARSIIKKAVNTVLSTPLQLELNTCLNAIENNLAQSSWICEGYFSAADIQLSYPLELAQTKHLINKDTHPNIHHFLMAISERPAYQSALNKTNAQAYLPYEEKVIDITEQTEE